MFLFIFNVQNPKAQVRSLIVFSLEASLLLSNKAKESLRIPEKSDCVKAKKQQMSRLTSVHEYSKRSLFCPRL